MDHTHQETRYDPVCGIRLEDGEPEVVRNIDGVARHFCSNACATRFEKNPKRYDGEPIIRMRGVVKTFGSGDAQTRVLRGVDLNIWEGDFISIVGASGSGKSTVLNVIGNLDRVTSGVLTVRGRDIATFSDEERAALRAKTFGFVFQQYNLIPWLTVLQNTLLPVIFSGKGRRSQEEALRERLASIDMSHRLNHVPSQLSGGEQQRVALVRALANDPDVVLGDEPTGNLDSETGKKILSILRDLNANHKKTLIIVTHDASIAALADHTIVLKDGRVVRNDAEHRAAATH